MSSSLNRGNSFIREVTHPGPQLLPGLSQAKRVAFEMLPITRFDRATLSASASVRTLSATNGLAGRSGLPLASRMCERSKMHELSVPETNR